MAFYLCATWMAVNVHCLMVHTHMRLYAGSRSKCMIVCPFVWVVWGRNCLIYPLRLPPPSLLFPSCWWHSFSVCRSVSFKRHFHWLHSHICVLHIVLCSDAPVLSVEHNFLIWFPFCWALLLGFKFACSVSLSHLLIWWSHGEHVYLILALYWASVICCVCVCVCLHMWMYVCMHYVITSKVGRTI